MPIYKFPTHSDLETFASDFLGVEYDDFYNKYYNLPDEDDYDFDYYDDAPVVNELEVNIEY